MEQYYVIIDKLSCLLSVGPNQSAWSSP